MSTNLGSVPSIPALEDAIRRAVAKALGDPNIKLGGLTWGKVEHGQPVGRTDALWAVVPLKTGKNEYEVAHTLGHAPGFVILSGSENRPSPTSKYAISWIRRDEWTGTTARIDVALLSGSMDGGVLYLIVGGER